MLTDIPPRADILPFVAERVESRLADHRPTAVRPARDRNRGYAGAPESLSPLQRAAFAVLHQSGIDIMRDDGPVLWDQIRWINAQQVAVPVTASLSTYDPGALTRLVLLSHARAIRLVIANVRLGRLDLTFSAMGNFDGLGRSQPSIGDAMASAPRAHDMTCGTCRYFDPLWDETEDDAEHGGASGSCRFPHGALPLAITKDSMALAERSTPASSWRDCPCWTARGDVYDGPVA